MDFESWRDRISRRSDFTSRITHLTKGDTEEKAFENLLSILENKKLNGGIGYVNGDIPVVCFQETPLGSIAENLLYEKYLRDEKSSKKNRYMAFGLRFQKIIIYSNGGRPVIYGDTQELKDILPEKEYWRIEDMKLTDQHNIVDWSHEREWRIKNELSFEYDQTEVIVPTREYYKALVSCCEENNRIDILKGINGIITLDSINY